MLVLASGDVSVASASIVDISGAPISVSLGVLAAGTVFNGVFTMGFISGTSSQAICYYE
jgi:hypothetical protein